MSASQGQQREHKSMIYVVATSQVKPESRDGKVEKL
jgi:hypothetical protein